MFSNLPEKSYDLIISNPPYVTAVAMEDLPPEYRHEPELALAGGEDGLDAVRTIVQTAPQFLNPGGTLVVEVGHNRVAAELAFPRLPFVWLETAGVDDGVFLLSREELIAGREAPSLRRSEKNFRMRRTSSAALYEFSRARASADSASNLRIVGGLARDDYLRDWIDQLGSRPHDRVEARLVEAIAVHVVQRDDGGHARLPGKEPHLAET